MEFWRQRQSVDHVVPFNVDRPGAKERRYVSAEIDVVPELLAIRFVRGNLNLDLRLNVEIMHGGKHNGEDQDRDIFTDETHFQTGPRLVDSQLDAIRSATAEEIDDGVSGTANASQVLDCRFRVWYVDPAHAVDHVTCLQAARRRDPLRVELHDDRPFPDLQVFQRRASR